MDDDDSSDWIGAYAAAKLAKERTGSIQDDALLLRARDGLMTARAREYVEGDGSEDKIYTMHTLPKRFFWAGFGSALDKNWVTGDFSTWIGRELHCRAYGVEFRRLEVEAAFPKVSPESSPTLQLAKHSDTMGRRADVRLVGAKRGPKPKIDQLKFNAEVARLLEEEGVPDPKLDSNFRQADLERHMMAWHGESVSESRNRELTVLAIEAFKKSKANN